MVKPEETHHEIITIVGKIDFSYDWEKIPNIWSREYQQRE